MHSKESREHIHYRMAKIPQKNTKIELLLRSKLHSHGLRFRKNVGALPGAPDIVFSRQRLAVFVDGDFWHGYDIDHLQSQLSQYWMDKIRRNIERDNRNNLTLRDLGWRVVRIWEHEIRNSLQEVVDRIEDALGSEVG